MRLFFTLLLILSFSASFANDTQYTPSSETISKAFSDYKKATVKPQNETLPSLISLRSMPLPNENKHQFRYLFKRIC